MVVGGSFQIIICYSHFCVLDVKDEYERLGWIRKIYKCLVFNTITRIRKAHSGTSGVRCCRCIISFFGYAQDYRLSKQQFVVTLSKMEILNHGIYSWVVYYHMKRTCGDSNWSWVCTKNNKLKMRLALQENVFFGHKRENLAGAIDLLEFH